MFFRNGVPLGHCRIGAAQLPLSPLHVASIASRAVAEATGDYLVEEGFSAALPGLPEANPMHPMRAMDLLLAAGCPLAGLDSAFSRPNGTEPSVTVAVCTRERPNDLARCLASVMNCGHLPLEILVVDNAPESDATEHVVKQFKGVRRYCEPRKGLSVARNAALEQSRGDIVAFIDDDAIAHPDWIDRVRRGFEDPQVMVVTGLVLPAELETPAQRIFEESYRFFHQGYRCRRFDSAYFAKLRAKGVPVWSIGAGANMAIRRTAYEHGLRFDTRLGPGVFGGCGEDSEFWYRVLALGWSCLYDPSACVFHYHRRDLADLRRLMYQYMKGHVAALILQYANYRCTGDLRRLLLALPFEYAILLLRVAISGFALENRIALRGVAGCVAGLPFIFRLLRQLPKDRASGAVTLPIYLPERSANWNQDATNH